MRISNHAEDRLKERCGLPKKAIERSVLKAFTDGITHCEVKGRLRKYIDWLCMGGHEVTPTVRLYGNHVYLFGRENSLITVLPLPTEHKSAVVKILRRKKE